MHLVYVFTRFSNIIIMFQTIKASKFVFHSRRVLRGNDKVIVFDTCKLKGTRSTYNTIDQENICIQVLNIKRLATFNKNNIYINKKTLLRTCSVTIILIKR